MGVIYKLKPEIRDFIVKIQSEKPEFGCRKIAILLEEKFQVKVSKSSINSVVKSAGIRMPVGRRLKKRRKRIYQQPSGILDAQEILQYSLIPENFEAEESGDFLLKAIDYLAGGSYYITELICRKLGSDNSDIREHTECLLKLPLFIRKSTPDGLNSYLNELQEVRELNSDIIKILTQMFREVRSIKAELSDGGSFYLDGQLRTIWPSPEVPDDFSATIYKSDSYVREYFQEESVLTLSCAPGNEVPGKDFFDFILDHNSQQKNITKLTFYDNSLKELKKIPVKKTLKRSFVFGLWPWQFSRSRKVNSIGDFKEFCFSSLGKSFYLAPIEVELMEHIGNRRVTLWGCAVKANLADKIRLVILGNYQTQDDLPQRLASLYFSRWPNLEEGSQDFSRKIEFFTYNASRKQPFLLQELDLGEGSITDTKQVLGLYPKLLDSYLRRRFFPSGYEKKSLPDEFHNLQTKIQSTKDQLNFIFKIPQSHSQAKDLDYALRRMNEAAIMSPDGRRVRLSM